MTAYTTADGLVGLALGEWQTGYLRGVSLTDRDLRLAARLRGLTSHAQVDVQPADGGVAIRTTGAVGLVRFTGFEVRVDPKFPGGHLGLLRLVEFASDLDGIVQLAGSPRMAGGEPNLLDLVVELLSRATERLIATGLRADYVEREGHLPALRGRLLPDRQQLERFGLYDRLVCRYDEHEHDIADNQLLALALDQGSRIATLPRVRRRARGLAAMLEEVCEPRELDVAGGPDGFTYTRHNEHYRPAHALSWLLLRDQGIDEELATGKTTVRSFLIDMNTLFERFVERAFRLATDPGEVAVEAQSSDSIFWRPETASRYARVRPDLLLESKERPQARLPVDAKYKRYEDRKVDVSDLTQAFLYAYAYRDPDTAGTPPRAILVHPTETLREHREMRLEVRPVATEDADAELAIVGVHIPTVLDAAETGGHELEQLGTLGLRMLPPRRVAGSTGNSRTLGRDPGDG